MSTSHNTARTNARTMLRRLAAGATLAVAPMLIALGAATASHGDTGITQSDNGSISAPTPHRAAPSHDLNGDSLPHTSLSHHQKRHYPY